MATSVANDPLVDELMKVDGKAEIVNGRIEELPMTGDEPSYASGKIFVSLDRWSEEQGGRAVQDGAGFLCDLADRKSFSPDAAFYTGPSGGKKFFPVPPVFAVEVRSENDYGLSAERAMARKRADYFEAGTLVVWDIDLDGDTEVIAKYVSGDPHNPQFFGKGQMADAEPAVPGWTLAVDALFAPVG
jgi:Uma2 family endonuclease